MTSAVAHIGTNPELTRIGLRSHFASESSGHIAVTSFHCAALKKVA
mgnify:CR=1 FL=1